MDTDRVAIGFFIKSSSVSLLLSQKLIVISMTGDFISDET
jgi:hypothetical protein